MGCIFLLKKDWHLDIFSDLATYLGQKMDAKNGLLQLRNFEAKFITGTVQYSQCTTKTLNIVHGFSIESLFRPTRQILNPICLFNLWQFAWPYILNYLAWIVLLVER